MHKRGCIQLEWAELRDKKLGLVYIESLPKWLVVIRTEGNRSSRLQGLWTLWSMGNTLFPPARNIKKIFLTIVTKCLLRDAIQLLYFRRKQLLYRNFCLTFLFKCFDLFVGGGLTSRRRRPTHHRRLRLLRRRLRCPHPPSSSKSPNNLVMLIRANKKFSFKNSIWVKKDAEISRWFGILWKSYLQKCDGNIHYFHFYSCTSNLLFLELFLVHNNFFNWLKSAWNWYLFWLKKNFCWSH